MQSEADCYFSLEACGFPPVQAGAGGVGAVVLTCQLVSAHTRPGASQALNYVDYVACLEYTVQLRIGFASLCVPATTVLLTLKLCCQCVFLLLLLLLLLLQQLIISAHVQDACSKRYMLLQDWLKTAETLVPVQSNMQHKHGTMSARKRLTMTREHA
jgi:hypothetical protein